MRGPTCTFCANLTPFSLQWLSGCESQLYWMVLAATPIVLAGALATERCHGVLAVC